jgi:hypothetical protein
VSEGEAFLLQVAVAIIACLIVFFASGLMFRRGDRGLLHAPTDALYDLGSVAVIIGLAGILGPALFGLIKILGEWLKARQRVQITLQTSQGTTKVAVENLNPEEVEKIIAALQIVRRADELRANPPDQEARAKGT